MRWVVRCWAMAFAVFGISAAVAQPPAPPAKAAPAVPLRFSYQPGASAEYISTANTRVKAKGPTGETESTLSQKLSYRVDVVGGEADGAAKLRLSVLSLRLELANGPARFLFDSATPAEPEGKFGRTAWPLLSAMAGMEATMTADARGQLRDVRLPDSIGQAIRETPGLAQLGGMLSDEGLRRMFATGFVFPETPAAMEPGKTTWTRVQQQSLAFGRQTTTTTYAYRGEDASAGVPLAAFDVEVELAYQLNPGQSVAIDRQESKGRVLFDPAAGLVRKSTLRQELDLRVSLNNQQVTQQVVSDTDVEWQPPRR